MSLHTFAVAKKAKQIIHITAPEQLPIQSWESPFLILGEGSNTVFLDDFDGDVIVMRNRGIAVKEDDESYLIEVGAGENWHQFVAYCLTNNIAGLENLALIPGSVGAAPVQNIGAYGVEVEQFIESVVGYDIVDGQFERLSKAQCHFSYRDSVFKQQLKQRFIITAVHFKIPKAWQANTSYGALKNIEAPTPNDIFEQVIQIRQSKLPDPQVLPNAGSFFKNPILTASHFEHIKQSYPDIPHYPQANGDVKVAAGWLIEQAGLKGKRIGDVAVHQKQALVLVNHGHCSSDDVIAMITLVQQQIHDKFDISLEHEVRLIGQSGETVFGVVNE